MSRGFLYTALGNKYYLEAEKSAKSLRRVSPDARICLITNSELSSDIFDEVILFKEKELDGKERYISKAYGMKMSPYEETIFVDTDTYFAESVDELFELMNFYDLAIAHDYMENSYALVNGKPLEGYRTYNTGVVALRKSDSMISFLDSWIHLYLTQIESYWSDQPAFMEALLYERLKVYSLQTNYNFRFNQFLTIPNGRVKILHGRHDDIEGIARILNRSVDHRSWDPKAWTCHGWPKSFNKKSLRQIIKRFFKMR